MTAGSSFPIPPTPAGWTSKQLRHALKKNDGGVWGADPDGGESDYVVLRSTEQSVDGSWQIEDPAVRKLTLNEFMGSRLEEGDIVITKSSGSELHIGKASIVTAEISELNCAFSNFMQRLRPCNDYEPRFIRYCLNSSLGREQMAWASSSTSGLANLSAGVLNALEFLFPDSNQQVQIADFLDQQTAKIDALIDEKERLLKLLDERRQALITESVTRGLDPTVPMKPSGLPWLGNIPAHWDTVGLRWVVGMQSGEGITSEAIEDSGPYPVYGGNGLRGFTLDYTHDGTYALIGRQGALCGNVHVADGKFWASEHAVVVTPKTRVDVTWLSELLRLMDLNQYSVSAAQPGLAVDRIMSLPIPLPPLQEQLALGQELRRLDQNGVGVADLNRRLIASLRLRRSALIHEAVTGQLAIGGAA